MKNKMLFIARIFIIIILIMPIIVSANFVLLGTFKQNDCINLIQICGNCTYNNITSVSYPNSNFALSGNYEMTKVSTKYNYTFCDTSSLGNYIVTGFGDLDGNPQTWIYNFEITSTGKAGDTILLFLSLGSVLIFAIAYLSKNEYIGVFSGMLFIITGIYIMVYGFGNFSDNYTRGLSFVSLGLGLIIAFSSVYEMFQED